jgi:hypothetical protein
MQDILISSGYKMEHRFTTTILAILEKHFRENAATIFELSPLLRYIDKKTRSANRGSKSRSSFANLYALYVLIEDYLAKGYHNAGKYSKYEGADSSPLLARMRQLPFGRKLQNHAINSRANDEFHKYFPDEERRPILRRVEKQKYWINEQLLIIKVSGKKVNIAESIIDIINAYVETKRRSFDRFIKDCVELRTISKSSDDKVISFIKNLLAPEKDARIFEIVSYAILKLHYSENIIFIGRTIETVKKENLVLYKTGRTNANDGGIDFVMKPLGRFFQVTETLDVKKYFLDIDKIERYPVTFVVKTLLSLDEIRSKLEEGAREQYSIDVVVEKYMNAIEEVINIPRLIEIFEMVVHKGNLRNVMDEIVKWSKVEFNYVEDDTESAGSVVDEDEDEE